MYKDSCISIPEDYIIYEITYIIHTSFLSYFISEQKKKADYHICYFIQFHFFISNDLQSGCL